jgi:hypothetical protein
MENRVGPMPIGPTFGSNELHDSPIHLKICAHENLSRNVQTLKRSAQILKQIGQCFNPSNKSRSDGHRTYSQLQEIDTIKWSERNTNKHVWHCKSFFL